MLLMVPDDKEPWPSLGGQVVDWIEDNLVFGPGDLRGQPARIDAEKQALIWRMYEVYPKGHAAEGRRRFKRVGISLPKGTAKTELGAWIAAAELSPDAPVRTVGWDDDGNPIGGPVQDPYIPLVAYTQEQSDELAYGALKAILEESPMADQFDIGVERILRRGGDGRCVSLAGSPNARDGARTTFSLFDEPLAIDTPIPTTEGWKAIGEVQAGDYVFGRDGKPVRVMGCSPVHKDRKCYKIRFTDGGEIVTDAGHKWKVRSKTNPTKEVTRTTQQMLDAGVDLSYGKRWMLIRNNGYDGRHVDLPIPPYILGLWLGDGAKDSGYISCAHEQLEETVSLIQAEGYKTNINQTVNRCPRILPEGLKAQLRELGVLSNKHIPNQYLFSSRQQRQALLQGLMDSDGHVTPRGNCTFVQNDIALCEQVSILVRSLGVNTSVCRYEDSRSRTSEMVKVHFTAHFQCFRLDRKSSLIRITDSTRSRTIMIDAIEETESVPVRCIMVDSPDHVFLAGRGLYLTHNTHWHTLPKLKAAHQTMMANIPKRKAADAWSMEITTAPEPGAGSIAEMTMDYALMVKARKIKDSRLFFFHRQASDEHDLSTEEGARAAVIEASGPAAEWRDIDSIVQLWADPTTDRSYWERVWCNRLVKGNRQAFDIPRWRELAVKSAPKKGNKIVIGFDGAQRSDSTGIVCCDVETGYMWVAGLWEQVPNQDDWSVPADEVDACVEQLFDDYDVWRMYADPPYWQSWIAKWQGDHGDDVVIEWWTNRRKQMSSALEGFDSAIKEGLLTHSGDKDLERHLGNSRKKELPQRAEDGTPLWLITKERSDSPHKIDLAMCAVLAWEARTDAISSGVMNETKGGIFIL